MPVILCNKLPEFFFIAIGKGMTMKEAIFFYLNMKDVVFKGSPPYDSDIIEAVLKDVFGMSSVKGVKVSLTATKALNNPIELKLFRNFPILTEYYDDVFIGEAACYSNEYLCECTGAL